MFKCDECGKIFSEYEVEHWSESRGEYWGMPCSEDLSGCPECRGNFHEVKQCVICDEWIDEDGLDICEDCLAKYKDEETFFELGKQDEDTVRLNGFLCAAFDREEIEEILLDYLQNHKQVMEFAVKNYEYDECSLVELVKERCKK